MEKHISKIFTFICMIFALLCSSCGATPIPKYSINVINGIGTSTYESGETATIQAIIPEYKDFDYWEVDGENVSSLNPYSFVVTKDATYKAIFKKQKASVTVINGTGGGMYDKGSTATITATIPEYKSFDYWEYSGQKLSSENPYSFTVLNNISLKAIFKSAKVTVTVVNGTGGGTFDKGTSVSVIANFPLTNQAFDYWECNGKSVSTDFEYEFNAMEDITLTAIYKDVNRGVLRTNATSIDINPIVVSSGGTITIDYKYVNPVTDADNGVSIFLGTDLTNCYGKYKIFNNRLDESYTGVTFSSLNDGYNRLVIVVSKLNQVRQDNNAPTIINQVLFRWFEASQGVYFDVKSEPVTNEVRGYLYKNAGTSIGLSKTYVVSEGGTIVLDYKYKDPVTDANNGVSLFFGTDDTNRFGNYKIFRYEMERSYNGITFINLDDGYNRIIVDVSLLDQVRSEYNAPTTITEISFRWFEAGEGVYFDVNPQDKVVKTTEFKMDDDEFVICNFTDIHVTDESFLSDTGTVGKTIKYAILNSKPDILVFSGDLAGRSSDLNYLCNYLDGFKIPYFFILGNHDHEGSLGYDTIAQRVNQSVYGYMEKGPDNLEHPGNYSIKIKNSNNQLVHGLVLMNSGNKYTVEDDSKVEVVSRPVSGVKYGTYKSKNTYCDPGWDGVRGNQIDWYEETVQSLGCETTLICHIAFLEYCKAYEQYQNAVNKKDNAAIEACAPIGECNMGEPICGSMVNFGLFDAIVENGSTKNVICGHDHLNDFSLLYQGVRLTYSIKTGEGSYWKNDGTRSGYTELTINSEGKTSLDQIYFNPLTK